MSSVQHVPASTLNHTKSILLIAFASVIFYMLVAHPAFAQPTGGTGNASQVGARVTNVTSQFLYILQLAGAAILTGAFMYVGYGMAWGGKKWSDVANVAYGALIAGLGSVLVGWLFS